MRNALYAAILVVPTLSAACSRPSRSDAAALNGAVGKRVVYDLRAQESEVVDVVEMENGHAVYVVSPSPACGGKGQPSVLSVLSAPAAGGSLKEEDLVELGIGEATSVAGHPSNPLAAVVMKSPTRPNVDPGKLLLVLGGAVVKSLPLGPGPDSVAISPDGRFAVVASEAETPDPKECSAERAEDDVPGSISVVDLASGPDEARIVAVVPGSYLFERFFREEPSRARRPEEIEPEFVAIAPDSSFALVTLQEQSAVTVLNLDGLRGGREEKGSREIIEARGRKALENVILLPHGLADRQGLPRGTHPDGIAVSPSGAYAITANEAHPRVRELQGISVLDLRGGLRGIKVVGNYSVLDLDPSLLRGARIRTKRGKRKGSVVHTVRLPRLDPEGAALARRGLQEIAAIAIEREAPTEEAGSVLLLDMTGILEGRPPTKIERTLVGANPGARPETLEFTKDGRLLYVVAERDGGTLTVIEL